eukprot:69996_1
MNVATSRSAVIGLRVSKQYVSPINILENTKLPSSLAKRTESSKEYEEKRPLGEIVKVHHYDHNLHSSSFEATLQRVVEMQKLGRNQVSEEGLSAPSNNWEDSSIPARFPL